MQEPQTSDVEFSMQTFVISSEAEWSCWRSAWNRLAKPNPMLSAEWLGAWWRAFGAGHQLHLVMVTDKEQLVGIVPTYLHNTRLGKQLRFLGSGSVCSDYLGPIVNVEDEAAVYNAISNHLRESVNSGELREVESFQLEGISADDRWHASLADFADDASFSLRTVPLANSWSLALPSSWEELHERQRGHGVHRKAKKCIARISSKEVSVRQLTDLGSLEMGMGALVRLHQARRESVGDKGCFADSRFENFLRDAIAGMVAEGTACFTICEKGEQVIGVQLLLLGSDTVFMYQSGVDPNFMSLEPGHCIVAGSLLYAISEGYKAYDFLRGDEPYKAFWGAQSQPLQRVILASPTFKAQAIEAVQRNLSWLRGHYSSLSTYGLSKS